MSSFFTVPGAQKKRKRPAASEGPKKRLAASKPNGKAAPSTKKFAAASGGKRRVGRDEDDDDDGSISGSDSDEVESIDEVSNASEGQRDEDSDDEAETAAERRLRLAEQYLENVKEHVDEAGFDAADIDRDLIAERLQEDIAETKGKVYRQLATELDFSKASQSFFRTNTNTVTGVAAHEPYFYTATKDIYLHKWRTQDLPQHQYPQTTRRKPQRAPAPPKRKPELETWIRGNTDKAKTSGYKRHTGRILTVATSPDGKLVVTGGEDKKIIVHDAETLKPIKVLTHHRDAVTGLAFRRGTNQLYSCSKDRTVKVWSLDEMAYVETLFGHQDVILDIDALSQERCISVGARDRTARLWKVIEETQLVFRGGASEKKSSSSLSSRAGIDPRSLTHEGSMDRIAMIDDELFVTGSDNGSIALWSVAKKKPVYIEPIAHGIDPPLTPQEASAEEHPSSSSKVIPAPTPRWITALKAIPFSDVILSGSWDGRIRIWRLSEDKRRLEPAGTLGASDAEDALEQLPQTNGTTPHHENNTPSTINNTTSFQSQSSSRSRPIPGIINDIALFERGDRGKDGLCVVAAIGKDHRLGRWRSSKNVRNGGVVFEIPRIPPPPKPVTNGVHESSDEDGDGGAGVNGE